MTEQSKYIAACYCRLSRDDNGNGVSESIETQRQILTDYCRKNNIAIYDFYCDDGVSGVTFQRPNFTRMMNDVDSGNVNTVIVKDLSRFGRNYIDGGKYLEEIFPEKGIRFIAIGDINGHTRANLKLRLQ